MTPKIQNALKAYHNPSCASIQDFTEDYDRPKKIKKIFSRYKRTGILNHRLLMNHIIAMRNVFEPAFFMTHLAEGVGPDHKVELNTFLVFLRMSLDMIDVDHELYATLKKDIRA